MPRERALKLEVADGIREVRLGAYRKTGNKAETEWLGRNRLGTEPYARWCGRTAGATSPPTRSGPCPCLFISETSPRCGYDGYENRPTGCTGAGPYGRD